jgi:valyl-tRNA synthetase
LKRVEGYRNFCNKIWNATRFVLMNVEGQDVAQVANPELWELPEQWIISRLQKAEAAVQQAFATYRLDLLHKRFTTSFGMNTVTGMLS